MAAGRGVIVVDPKGDLVADVLDRVPAERTGDVVRARPGRRAAAGRPQPAGPARATRPELVVDQVVSIFHELYRDSWGPRTDDILRAALLTLVGVPGMTLAEVPLLLTDPGFRRPLVGRINDPVALGPFWGWYDGLSDGERTAAIGPVMNKLRTFLLRRRLRNILGQADPAFDFDQALADAQHRARPADEGAARRGGRGAARLARGHPAVAGGAAPRGDAGRLTGRRRSPTSTSSRTTCTCPTGVETMLAQARGLGLGLTLAHQHLGQLPASVREAVLANARSRVIFQVAAGDAAGAGPRAGAPPDGGRSAGPRPLRGGGHACRPAPGWRRRSPAYDPARLRPPPARPQRRGCAPAGRYGVDRAEVEAAIQAAAQRAPGRRAGRPPEVVMSAQALAGLRVALPVASIAAASVCAGRGLLARENARRILCRFRGRRHERPTSPPSGCGACAAP